MQMVCSVHYLSNVQLVCTHTRTTSVHGRYLTVVYAATYYYYYYYYAATVVHQANPLSEQHNGLDTEP